jgi:phage terminase large subunit-like protein
MAEAHAREHAAALTAWAERSGPEGYYFDELAAARAVAFFPRYLRHTKGRWVGQVFNLDIWQEVCIRLAFGWKRPDDTRRFRIVYVRIPRKNGKTGLAGGVGLMLTFADHEAGAEVYSFANDTDQAAIAFNAAKAMRVRSPKLARQSLAYKKTIVVGKTGSVYKVLSSEAASKDGLNASGLIGDEIHASKSRALYDVLHTSTGAREQPLEFLITTAGDDIHSLCYEFDDYGEKVLAGIIEDPEFLPVLFGADREADISDPAVWARANPSLGKTVSVDYIRKQAAKARQIPAYENTFKRLHLDIWTEQTVRWLPMTDWDACAGALNHEDLARFLEGRKCYGGLDLSRKIDISALELSFPPDEDQDEPWYVLSYFWVPEERITQRAKRDRVPYDVWAKQGFIKPTEGNVVDYDVIRADINALRERFVMSEIGFDPWNATQLSTQLMSDGFEMVEVRQGPRSLSEACKFLEAQVVSHGLVHGGNKVLRWMASNAVIRTDANENIAPDKAKARERIDGIVALVTGLSRAIAPAEDAPTPQIVQL